MSKLVESMARFAEQIHGGHLEREQEVRERKTQERERKCEMAEFQHRLAHDRTVAANLAHTERYAYVENVRRQATAIRAEGQAMRERARDLRATQTIPFVNDVRQQVDTMRHRLSSDIAVMRQLLADSEYTTRVTKALEVGESVPSPAPEFVQGRPSVSTPGPAKAHSKTAQRRPAAGGAAGALGGVTDTVGGVVQGATGAVGGVTDTAGGAVQGVTGALGGVLGGVTGALGGVTDTVGGVVQGATGALGGVTDTVGGVVQGATGAVGGVTDTAGGAVQGVTGALGRVTSAATNALGEVVRALEGAADALEKAADALVGKPGDIEGAPEGTTSALGGATDAIGDAVEGATGILGEATEGVTNTLGEATDAVEGATEASTSELPEVPAETAPLPDDLTAIQGIGQREAESLLEGGIDNYAKLAAATPEDLAQVLKCKIPNMEDWVTQARKLVDSEEVDKQDP